MLGSHKINPFGDLHTMQHLSARLARMLRGLFEPLLREELRCWAEPLVVQRFTDYRAERGDGLSAWVPMAMSSQGGMAADAQALIVIEGGFGLSMIDLSFGGTGNVPDMLPPEFSPASEAMIGQLGRMMATPMRNAWESLAKLDFRAGRPESSPSLLSGIEGEDAMIVTRFGIAGQNRRPSMLDILYPVSALKPHGSALTGKVVDKQAEAHPTWRGDLTRAVMTVRFPVRSVLAEPVVPLSRLMELKTGDVIPISFGPEVPVMVGGDLLGTGTVGTANGRAAVQLTSLARPPEAVAQSYKGPEE
ncbi:flagellar motor switch protein FliM [uncultured Sphingomonas sp.]|uniref:flagellar motor switch protein FliM n=1 Tax=uncultured Sphingomonas sp. TaxID=158754 RepID=UPI0025D635F5|nr:FliM/FliN family flagellar motor switch protein [uncultured Sphingomonas sp.]